MNSFSRLNNALINSIDNKAIDVKDIKPHQDLKNTLKTIVEAPSSRLFNRTDNDTFTIKLSKNYDNLSQIILKVKMTITKDLTVTTPPSTLSIEQFLGARIFKEIYLQTVDTRFQLQKIIPTYTLNRTDEINNSRAYSHIDEGIQANEKFEDLVTTPSTQYFYIPLFFFFSDHPQNFLNTRKLTELELKLISNDSPSKMGIVGDRFESLTINEVTAICTFHDTAQTSINDELIYIPKKQLKPIVGSYNIFEEDIVQLATGQTSARFLIRCNYPLYCTNFNIINDNEQKHQINSIKFKINGQEFVKLDFRANYSLYIGDYEKKFVQSGSFSYWWSILKKRTMNSGMITFSGSDNMSPVMVEVEFDAIPDETYRLVTYSEHLTEFEVDEYGNIRNKVSDSKLRYNQSYLPTNLGP